MAKRTFFGSIDAGLRELADFVSRLWRGKLTTIPPRSLRDVGGSNFEATGQEFLGYFVELGELKPTESVLEIGCGCGRMALPLTHYLADEGHYVGMDIVKRSIKWCRKHITSKYPNFEFYHVDLDNPRYNTGSLQAKDHVFPFDDYSFDFVYLTSVFTHMLPEDMENYVGEIARLMKQQGRALITYFLLNDAQAALETQGKNVMAFPFTFPFERGIYRAREDQLPERGLAYEEPYVRELLAQHGLQIDATYYGYWSGRETGLSLQDILIISKAKAGANDAGLARLQMPKAPQNPPGAF
jgi:SAM-dependent methyltransferase